MRLFALIVAGLLTLCAMRAATGLAQTPEPATPTTVPTPGPDEIVVIGEVPAPAGTTVTVKFLNPDTLEIVECGSATTAPSESGDPQRSRFVLTIDVECVFIGLPGGVCWAPLLCNGLELGSREGGRIIDMGLLTAPLAGTPTPLPLVHGDGGPDVVLPAAGGGRNLGSDSWQSLWLVGAGAVLLTLGLAASWLHRELAKR